jgi:phage-related minor tail protein
VNNIGITLSADNRAMIRALQEADRAMSSMSRDMTGALRQVEAQARSTGQAMAGMGGGAGARGMQQSVRDMNNLGMSAKATSAALRNVPAQFTDIVVSLQGGQAPLTVLLQQGGQLKDMFGGIGPAARALGGYVAGLVNPFTVAASAAAVLGLAYKQGSDEADAFRRSLLLTGNAAGTTVDQLAGMAASMDQAFGVTTGKAASALSAMAGTGQVARASLQDFAQVAIDMEKSFGQSIEDTAKSFAELGKDPVGASKRLNDSLNYLTAATYEQIQAAVELGETEKAAAIAQNAYAEAMAGRAKTVVENLGYIERAYRASLNWAKEAWDAILGVGRADSTADQMAKVKNQLDLIDKGLKNVSDRQKAGLEAQLAALQETERLAKMSGDRQAAQAKAEKAGIAAVDQAAKDREKARQKAISDDAKELAAKKKAQEDFNKYISEFENAHHAANVQRNKEKLDQLEQQKKFANDLVESLEFETQLLGLGNEERERAVFLRDLENKGILEGTEAYEKIIKAREAYEQKSKQVEHVEKEKKAYEDMWKSVDREAERIFIDIARNGEDAFKRIGKSIEDYLLRMLYEITVKQWIIQVAGSFGGPAGSAAFSALGGASGAGGIGSAIGGIGVGCGATLGSMGQY